MSSKVTVKVGDDWLGSVDAPCSRSIALESDGHSIEAELRTCGLFVSVFGDKGEREYADIHLSREQALSLDRWINGQFGDKD